MVMQLTNCFDSAHLLSSNETWNGNIRFEKYLKGQFRLFPLLPPQKGIKECHFFEKLQRRWEWLCCRNNLISSRFKKFLMKSRKNIKRKEISDKQNDFVQRVAYLVWVATCTKCKISSSHTFINFHPVLCLQNSCEMITVQEVKLENDWGQYYVPNTVITCSSNHITKSFTNSIKHSWFLKFTVGDNSKAV